MIEIETRDPEVASKLKALVDSARDQIQDISSHQMSGPEVVTILIENIDTIGIAAVGILATLRFDILKLKISKDGVELSGKKKEEVLARGDDA
jgi:hypothetical protein